MLTVEISKMGTYIGSYAVGRDNWCLLATRASVSQEDFLVLLSLRFVQVLCFVPSQLFVPVQFEHGHRVVDRRSTRTFSSKGKLIFLIEPRSFRLNTRPP